MDAYKLDADYLETLKRMYRSSRILYEKGEYYNCSYLCGYVLECALKYILLKYGKKDDGTKFELKDVVSMSHNTDRLNQNLLNYIDHTDGILSRFRIDFSKKAPYMLNGREGQKAWDPKYRYGEHPKWDEQTYCERYMSESEYIFGLISDIVISDIV